MTENKRYIITLETIVEAEDIFKAVTIGTELSMKYKEDKYLDLKGVLVDEDVKKELAHDRSKLNCAD